MRILFTERHRLRDARSELYGGQLRPPFESPDRAELVRTACLDHGVGELHAPAEWGLKPIQRIHDPAYVEFLSHCWERWAACGFAGEAIASVYPTRRLNSERIPKHIDGLIGYYALASETSISEGTWQAAVAAADTAISAADHLFTSGESVFALCRPPGHHAARDQFGGYCFLNNAAIAAQGLLDRGMGRVAILDIDFHHGNGTQDIFYERSDVFFASLHGDPAEAFPYFLGYADEAGSGDGRGYNLNLPMGRGTDYAAWASRLSTALEAIDDYGAEALVVSLGLDAYREDPISFFALDTVDFHDCGRRIAELGLPCVFVLEGGYANEALGRNTAACLNGLQGRHRHTHGLARPL